MARGRARPQPRRKAPRHVEGAGASSIVDLPMARWALAVAESCFARQRLAHVPSDEIMSLAVGEGGGYGAIP